MIARILPALLLGLVAFGCSNLSGPTVVGNGVVKSESRTVDDFHGVAGYGVGAFKIRLGDKTAVQVRCEENLLPYLKTQVNNSVLAIGVGNGSFTWHGWPEADITTKELRSIHLAGSTSAEVLGIDTETFDAKGDGSTTIRLDGQAKTLTVNLLGSSKVNADSLKCRKATIRCTGSCHVVVSVSEELTVDATGSCTVEYIGAPKLKVNTTGVSKVVERK